MNAMLFFLQGVILFTVIRFIFLFIFKTYGRNPEHVQFVIVMTVSGVFFILIVFVWGFITKNIIMVN